MMQRNLISQLIITHSSNSNVNIQAVFTFGKILLITIVISNILFEYFERWKREKISFSKDNLRASIYTYMYIYLLLFPSFHHYITCLTI